MLRDAADRDKTTIVFAMPHAAFGGAERLAGAIMRHLVQDGLRVIAAILTHDGRLSDSAPLWLEPHAEIRRLDRAPDVEAALLGLLAETDCAALVLYGLSCAYRSLPRIAAECPDLRIASFQFNDVECVAENRLYAPMIDVVVAESPKAAAVLDGTAVIVVPSGVDVAALAARPRVRADGERLTVGFVGRFDQTKCPDAFVRMVAALRRPDVRFVMAGTGRLWRTIARRIGALKPPVPIALPGLLDDEALLRLMDGLDVLVVPSRIDGRPVVIQEAQARGIAVVGHRVGGIPELVRHEETGLLCDPEDPGGLAAAVGRLLDDPALRARLGAAAQAHALRHGDIATVLPSYAAAITGRRPDAASAA
jgi:glycosyltransferase involved in cell wall biosynthesis